MGEDRIDLAAEPTVILMVGVNGTGKTTTIGKIAWHLRRELGQASLLGAGDTFRAAAVEQLAAVGASAPARDRQGEPRAPIRARWRSTPSRPRVRAAPTW